MVVSKSTATHDERVMQYFSHSATVLYGDEIPPME